MNSLPNNVFDLGSDDHRLACFFYYLGRLLLSERSFRVPNSRLPTYTTTIEEVVERLVRDERARTLVSKNIWSAQQLWISTANYFRTLIESLNDFQQRQPGQQEIKQLRDAAQNEVQAMIRLIYGHEPQNLELCLVDGEDVWVDLTQHIKKATIIYREYDSAGFVDTMFTD